MSKKEAVKNIPVREGYTEPVVKDFIETVDYYVVKTERFLNEDAAKRKAKRLKVEVVKHNDSLTVYEVDGERFLDADKAEKKRKSLVKKYRDEIRETVRVYGIDKASQAAKLQHMEWLIRYYSLDELKNAKFFWSLNSNKEALVRKKLTKLIKIFCEVVYGKSNLVGPDPLDTNYPLSYFFETEDYRRAWEHLTPYRSLTEFRKSLNIFRIHFNAGSASFNRDWAWLKNTHSINGYKVPNNFQFRTPEFNAWIDAHNELTDKIYKIMDLVDYRMGELLYKAAFHLSDIDSDGKVLSVPPFDAALFNVHQELVETELLKIIEFIDGNVNGVDFHIAVKQGELTYWLNDDKRDLSPFKQF